MGKAAPAFILQDQYAGGRRGGTEDTLLNLCTSSKSSIYYVNHTNVFFRASDYNINSRQIAFAQNV